MFVWVGTIIKYSIVNTFIALQGEGVGTPP